MQSSSLDLRRRIQSCINPTSTRNVEPAERQRIKLRVIRVDSERSEQQRLSARLAASAVRLDRHEHSVDLLERSRIINLKHPALLGNAVLIKHAKTERLLPVRAVLAPRLKCAGLFYAALLIEIVRIEDQRFPLSVEHAAVRFLGGTVASHVVDLGNIKVARSHEVADIPVLGEQVFLLGSRLLALPQLGVQVFNLRLETPGPGLILGPLLADQIQLSLHSLQRRLSGIQILTGAVLLLRDFLSRTQRILTRALQAGLRVLRVRQCRRLVRDLALELPDGSIPLVQFSL